MPSLATLSAAATLAADTPRTRVIRKLKQAIARGELTTDDCLPSERLIAERLEVARGTVRSALAELEDEGWIATDSKRRRVIVPERVAAAPTLLQDVLAVLSTEPGQPDALHQSPGWERYVEYGALDAIRGAGYHALWLEPELLAHQQDSDRPMTPPQGVVAGRKAALTAAGRDLLCHWRSLGVTIVVYEDTPGSESFDRVVSDHALGARLLTQWLLQQGRRRILRVWHGSCKDYHWLGERDRGYLAALAEAGVAPLPPLYLYGNAPNDERRREIFEAQVSLVTGYLLPYFRNQPPPDAIMAISDGDVFTAAAALRRLGLEPGRDLPIVGYDNYWQDVPERGWANAVPAATVDKRNPAIGAALVELLRERRDGKLPAEPQLRLVPPELIVPQL